MARTLSGTITVDTTSTGTTAVTVEENLWATYSLPANTLSTNGDAVRVTVWGTTGSDANQKTIRLYFGGTTVVVDSGSRTWNNKGWQITAIIVRTGPSAQDVIAWTEVGTGANMEGTSTFSALTKNLAVDQAIKVTGQNGTATLNDVVFEGVEIEFLKAAGQSWQVSDSDNLTLSGSGNIGVGTSSPGYRVTVNDSGSVGGLSVSSSASAALNIDTTGGNPLLRVNGSTQRVGIGTTSPAYTLDVAGRVGINVGGTAVAPQLLVEGDGAVYPANIALRRANSTGATGNIDWLGNTNIIGARIGVNDDVGGAMQFKLGGTGAVGDTRIIILSGGNVGIGTTSPGALLDVNGDGRIKKLRLYDSTTLTIANGAVVPTQNYHAVDTESAAAADDLDTLTTTNVAAGFILILRAADTSHIVTVKDGTGNLLLNGDYELSATDRTITLLYDGTNWRELARSVTISGGNMTVYPATLLDVVNTTSQTAALSFTVPANGMADGDLIEMEIALLVKNNKGSLGSVGQKLYWGATNVDLVTSQQQWPDLASEYRWFYRYKFMRVGADIWARTGDQGVSRSEYDYPFITQDRNTAAVMSAPTFSSTQTVALKITLDAANANYYFKPQRARIWKISTT